MWGQHLILDGRAGTVDRVRSGDDIREFCRLLVERIDMVAYGPPVVQHFAVHSPEAAGYSLVQLIETSSITGHFVDCNGDFYLDVFSCKPFDSTAVVALVREFFDPEHIKVVGLARDARRPGVAALPAHATASP